MTTDGRVMMVYRDIDFVPYVLSLLIAAAYLMLAFVSGWQRLAVGVGILYMLYVFIRKHGARLDFASIGDLFKESLGYPLHLIKELHIVKSDIGLLVVTYGAVIVAESWLAANTLRGSFLLEPFPYPVPLMIHFVVLTGYRTLILADHIRKRSTVSAVLSGSTIWKRVLDKLGVLHHLFHAYLTGILCHLSELAPAMIFYRLTEPTLLREAMLTVLVIPLAVFNRPDESTLRRYNAWFMLNHRRGHVSRFWFTLFHGHHHDAIPSALIATDETGLTEGFHRSIVWGYFLQPITVFWLLRQLPRIWVDIRGHQYIPGIFPYSRFTVRAGIHHVAHHYGSFLPLGIGTFGQGSSPGAIAADFENGYKLSNSQTKWYLEQVRRHEMIEEVECSRFLSGAGQPAKHELEAV